MRRWRNAWWRSPTRSRRRGCDVKLYRFLTGPDDASFCKRVSAALNKGWQLHGSPSLTWDGETRQRYCGQAVVKDVVGVAYTDDTVLGDW